MTSTEGARLRLVSVSKRFVRAELARDLLAALNLGPWRETLHTCCSRLG